VCALTFSEKVFMYVWKIVLPYSFTCVITNKKYRENNTPSHFYTMVATSSAAFLNYLSHSNEGAGFPHCARIKSYSPGHYVCITSPPQSLRLYTKRNTPKI